MNEIYKHSTHTHTVYACAKKTKVKEAVNQMLLLELKQSILTADFLSLKACSTHKINTCTGGEKIFNILDCVKKKILLNLYLFNKRFPGWIISTQIIRCGGGGEWHLFKI